MFTTYMRVLVDKNGSLSYQDLTSLDGRNWIESASWTETIDTPCMTANISLVRAVDYLSLSPYMASSKYNNGTAMIAVRRRIQIQTATVPVDCLPISTDWTLMFDGYVDEIDPTGDNVTLTCRDLGALLMDSWIRTEKTYGSTAGIALQTVIQTMLDDAINTPLGLSGGSAITLTTIGSPNFLMKSFIGRKQSCMDSIRQLAQQIAWDVKYVWSGTAFQLQLYQPNRTVGAALTSFGPDDYDTITQAKQSVADVRNYVLVPYSDYATGTRQTIIAQDATSIALYGLRYMEISEAATSQVNTAAEATLLANGALSDLKSPVLDQTVEMPYFFGVQVGDSYTWKANNRQYDTDQQLAVVTYTHTIDKSGAKTAMGTRGQASGGYMRWLTIEGRAGVAPTSAQFDPASPQNVAAAGSPGTIVIIYDPPAMTDASGATLLWGTTEVWGKIHTGVAITQSTTGGKNVRPTGTGVTLYASAKKTRFEISGLTPGTVYDFAIVVIDVLGNIGPMALLTSQTAQQVGPYHETTAGQKDQLMRNPDLNIYTLGTGFPPDGWITRNFTWLSSFVDTTNQLTGTRALKFPNTGIPVGIYNTSQNYWTMDSVGIPITGGEIYNATAYGKGVVSADLLVWMTYFNAAGTAVSQTANGATIGTTAYSGQICPDNQCDVTSRTLVIGIECGSVYVDRVYLARGAPASENAIIGWTSMNTFAAATETVLHFLGSNMLGLTARVGAPDNDAVIISTPGTYDCNFTLYCHLTSGAATGNMSLRLYVSSDNGASWTGYSAMNTWLAGTTPTLCRYVLNGLLLYAGDLVQMRCLHASAGTQDFESGINTSRLNLALTARSDQ